jgi:hypothetical protein
MGNAPEKKAFKPNSKRSSRYQASRSEKKALNFIRSLSSVFLKNTGGTRTRISNSDLKRIEGWFLQTAANSKG